MLMVVHGIMVFQINMCGLIITMERKRIIRLCRDVDGLHQVIQIEGDGQKYLQKVIQDGKYGELTNHIMAFINIVLLKLNYL